MIITRLAGGLGNQMFEYAAGLALAQYHQTVLKMDVSWYSREGDRVNHERYGLGCFNISEHFASVDEIERAKRRKPKTLGRALTFGARKARVGWMANLLAGTGPVFYEPDLDKELTLFDQCDGTYLHGLWQSELYFVSVGNLLRRYFSFRYPLPASAISIRDQIRRDPAAVMLHIRRGDFGKRIAGEFNQPLPVDYYHRALSLLSQKKEGLRVYVFSNDMEWAAKNFRCEFPVTFVHPSSDWQAFDEMALMTECRHFIIANSTFSWWAAWLGQFEAKFVYAPDPWFSCDKSQYKHFLPDSWHAVAL